MRPHPLKAHIPANDYTLSCSPRLLPRASFACYAAARDRNPSIAANARIHMMMSPMTSGSRSKTVSKDASKRPQPARTAPASRPHVAAAAAIDELLANEARASLRRARETFREDAPKVRPRITVPPARIVAKPLQSPAWRAPFFSLAIVVGLSTLISAGGIAYLFMRPQATRVVTDAELRSIRETISQLRRQVADLSSATTSNRVANSTQPTIERVAVRTNNRDLPLQRTKVGRSSEEGLPTEPIAQAPEFTGSVQPSVGHTANTQRSIIEGWHIRRAYDGAALLESTSSIIEVAPGQDVPALGRIQEIRSDNGRWQVITSKGIVLGR